MDRQKITAKGRSEGTYRGSTRTYISEPVASQVNDSGLEVIVYWSLRCQWRP